MDETSRVSITPGMFNALGRGTASAHACGGCGLTLPRYPGRYPGTCPKCGGVVARKPADEGADDALRAAERAVRTAPDDVMAWIRLLAAAGGARIVISAGGGRWVVRGIDPVTGMMSTYPQGGDPTQAGRRFVLRGPSVANVARNMTIEPLVEAIVAVSEAAYTSWGGHRYEIVASGSDFALRGSDGTVAGKWPLRALWDPAAAPPSRWRNTPPKPLAVSGTTLQNGDMLVGPEFEAIAAVLGGEPARQVAKLMAGIAAADNAALQRGYRKMREAVVQPPDHLGVPRANMPQIDDPAHFLAWLRLEGVAVVPGRADLRLLRATQSELETDKIAALMQAPDDVLQKPLITSTDDRVIDGHHRWAALLERDPEAQNDVLQVQLTAREILDLCNRYPGVERRTVKEALEADHEYPVVDESATVPLRENPYPAIWASSGSSSTYVVKMNTPKGEWLWLGAGWVHVMDLAHDQAPRIFQSMAAARAEARTVARAYILQWKPGWEGYLREGATVPSLPVVAVSIVPRLQALIEAGRESGAAWLGDPACSRGRTVSFSTVDDQLVAAGGMRGLQMFLEGPAPTGYYWRLEGPRDPVLVFDCDETARQVTIFATQAPERVLGSDPRADLVVPEALAERDEDLRVLQRDAAGGDPAAVRRYRAAMNRTGQPLPGERFYHDIARDAARYLMAAGKALQAAATAAEFAPWTGMDIVTNRLRAEATAAAAAGGWIFAAAAKLPRASTGYASHRITPRQQGLGPDWAALTAGARDLVAAAGNLMRDLALSSEREREDAAGAQQFFAAVRWCMDLTSDIAHTRDRHAGYDWNDRWQKTRFTLAEGDPGGKITAPDGRITGPRSGQGAMRAHGGFRFEIGHNRRRKPRLDVQQSIQNRLNAKRGLAKRIRAAKAWHRSGAGRAFHRDLGRYNAGNRRGNMTEDRAATFWGVVLPRALAETGGDYQAPGSPQDRTVDDIFDALLRRLIVIESLDVLQDVEFADDGSIYLFFDPSLGRREIDEILLSLHGDQPRAALVGSPDSSLPGETARADWWVVFVASPLAPAGQVPDPTVYAWAPGQPGTAASPLVRAAPASVDQLAMTVDWPALLKGIGAAAPKAAPAPAAPSPAPVAEAATCCGGDLAGMLVLWADQDRQVRLRGPLAGTGGPQVPALREAAARGAGMLFLVRAGGLVEARETIKAWRSLQRIGPNCWTNDDACAASWRQA